MNANDKHTLEKLFEVIAGRKGSDSGKSYTAALFEAGTPAIARKVGEEAVETVVAALGPDKKALAAESADLLYHLMVLWADRGLAPEDIWAELRGRRSLSGHAEKASRKGR